MVYLSVSFNIILWKLTKYLSMIFKDQPNAGLLSLTIGFLLLFSFTGWGQTTETQNDWEKLNQRVAEMCPDLQNSFQIQVSNTIRAYPSIPGNLCDLVIKNRRQSKTSYYELSKYVRIKILSADEFKAREKSERPIKPITHTSF